MQTAPVEIIWLTPVQAARRFQVHPNTIYEAVRRGLPHTRIGRLIRIRQDKLDEWAERGWQEE